jgi:hypothetical protein
MHNHTPFPNATAGNLESVGNQPLPVSGLSSRIYPILSYGSQQGNGYGVGALPYFQPSLSDILKRILCDRIAHAGSKVVGFLEEECGPGRSRMTVTFETSGEN